MKTGKVTFSEGLEYKIIIAESELEKTLGLRNILKLPDGKGMLFIWDRPLEVSMTMLDTLIPLDLIFMDEDGEVLKISHREDIKLNNLVSCDNVKFVLEVNINSGIEEGDVMDSDEIEESFNTPIMKVLAPDGSTLMELKGGERIFSRPNTKILIKQAKKADKTKSESDYKRLGRSAFKYLNVLDNRDPEYVEAPK